jgi:hypothetical protein
VNFLKKLAPFLSTGLSLAGPYGAIASKILMPILGLKPGAKEDDYSAALAKATPEQIEAIKKAEQDFQLQMKQLDIQSVDELEKIAAGDRASARDMQVKTKSWIPGTLAITITLGFFVLLGGMMFGKLHPADNQALLLLLGSLSMAFGAVISYYFGSSAGSDRKTELLANTKGAQ